MLSAISASLRTGDAGVICAAAAMLVATFSLVACAPVAPKYAAKVRCQYALSSRICDPEPDGPETGDGLSQPDVLQHIQSGPLSP